jgi:hypothetical protein
VSHQHPAVLFIFLSGGDKYAGACSKISEFQQTSLASIKKKNPKQL